MLWHLPVLYNYSLECLSAAFFLKGIYSKGSMSQTVIACVICGNTPYFKHFISSSRNCWKNNNDIP